MWGLAMANASSNLRQDLQVGKEPLIFQNVFFLKTPIAATPSTEDRNSLGPGAIPSPLSTCRPIPLAIYGALIPVFNEPLSELLDFGFALGVEEVLAEGND